MTERPPTGFQSPWDRRYRRDDRRYRPPWWPIIVTSLVFWGSLAAFSYYACGSPTP